MKEIKLTDWNGIPGYKDTDIKKALTNSEYKSFSNFIRGQTVGLMEDGTHLIYEWDFNKWKYYNIK